MSTLSVAEVLALPVIAAGDPEVYSRGTSDALLAVVRWVHVSELLDIAPLLEGGELVLSTGLLLDTTTGDAAIEHIRALQDSGAVGLIVELKGDRDHARSALRIAATHSRIPLIVLRKSIRFVEVTETVHRTIVAEQYTRIEQSRHAHEVFTQLSLEAADAERIVSTAARLLGRPVVLEDPLGRVIAIDALGVDEAFLLHDWEERSRADRHAPRWPSAPVGGPENVWARIITPDESTHDHVDIVDILARAGQAIAINRMAERDRRELIRSAHLALMSELRGDMPPSPASAAARATALGVDAAPSYVPIVVVPRSVRDQTPLRLRGLHDLLDTVLERLERSALIAAFGNAAIAMLLPVPAGESVDQVLGIVSEALTTAPEQRLAVSFAAGAGTPRAALPDAAIGLGTAHHIAEADRALSPVQVTGADCIIARATDVRLRGLLAMLGKDSRVTAFVRAELGSLLEPGNEESLALLEQFLAVGGNKAALARKGFLSRPTLYHRLAQIEKALGVSLAEAESRTALHVAVLANRVSQIGR